MSDELFNAEPTLARIFRRPPSEYAAEFHEFEQRFQYLRHHCSAQARQIEDKTGISRIAVTTGYGDVCLGNDQDIANWFQKALTSEEERFVASLRVLNRRLGKQSFAELLESSLVKDGVSLQRYVTLLAWQRAKGRLWEWVMLLTLISGLRRVVQTESHTIRLSPGALPIPISLHGHDLYLWYQRQFRGHRSGLSATPDLMLTLDSVEPNEQTIHAIIECKHTRRIGSDAIRSLWATAEDVQAAFAILASFESVSWSIRDGAERLGLNILENPIADLKRILGPSPAVDLFAELTEQLEDIEYHKPLDKSRFAREKLMDEKRRQWY